MSTKHGIILLNAAIFLMTAACSKPDYKACFTTSKDTFLVGETIWFFNCSDFDNGTSENACVWTFEPGQTDLIVTSGHDSISWMYTTAGIKTTKLTTGTKENGDAVSKQIVVNP